MVGKEVKVKMGRVDFGMLVSIKDERGRLLCFIFVYVVFFLG